MVETRRLGVIWEFQDALCGYEGYQDTCVRPYRYVRLIRKPPHMDASQGSRKNKKIPWEVTLLDRAG